VTDAGEFTPHGRDVSPSSGGAQGAAADSCIICGSRRKTPATD